MSDSIKLKIITQENILLSEEVDSVSLPTQTGQITILPKHIPLCTRIVTGELIYRLKDQVNEIVVADGFADISANSEVSVMVDSAVRAKDIDLLKAQAAKKAAEEIMKQKLDQKDFVLAEAQLRKALTEIQSFNKRKNFQK